MINKKLSEKIRSRRKELKMSQEELASLVGYTDRSIISRIEKGLIDLTESKIIAIAKALNVTPEILVGWESKKEEKESVKTAARDKKVFDKYSKLDEAKRKIVEALIDSYFDENVEDEED